MAFIPGAHYPPGKIDTTDPDYPYGKAQDVSAPSAGDGTPWTEIFLNDIWGCFQTLLFEAGIVPSGNADKLRVSDYYRSMRKLFGAVFDTPSALRAGVSSEFKDDSIITVADVENFSFYQVKTGTVTEDGVRNLVFSDDANRYASRVSSGFLFSWRGTFSPLSSVDDGRYLLFGNYSTVPPASTDYRFPVGARLTGITFSNRGSEQISGLQFHADSSPANPIVPASIEFALTPKVDIDGGETRFIPVTNGAPDLANPMALAFTARKIDLATLVTIQFVFELEYEAQTSQSEEIQRGDLLAPVEAAGVVDLAGRIADNNYRRDPERFDVGDTKQYAVRTLKVGGVRNQQNYSEDPQTGSNYTMTSASATVDSTDTIDVVVNGDAVKLTRLLDTSAVSLLESISGGFGPLTLGDRYLMSYYVLKATEGDARFHMREISTPLASPGHGQRLATKGLRRVWSIIEGGGPLPQQQCYAGDDPALAYASGAAENVNLFAANLGPLTGDLSDVYVGGFQVEPMDSPAASVVDGICMVGDEVMAGVDTYPAFSAAIRAAGNPDDVRSVQVSRWLETELNCRVFNRAIEGDALSDMATRWATDITPIATAGDQARYVIIQGGANDAVPALDAGVSVATMLANLKILIAALNTLALADGLIPVFLTVSPHPGLYGARNTMRQDYNDWLQTEYALVININQVLESSDEQSIVRQPGYSPDGFNLGTASKKAVGEFIARQQFWILPRPTPYQRVATTTEDVVLFEYKNVALYSGTGSPEGVVAAIVGSRYWREDPTGAGDATYAKITGVGSTGWAAGA